MRSCLAVLLGLALYLAPALPLCIRSAQIPGGHHLPWNRRGSSTARRASEESSADSSEPEPGAVVASKFPNFRARLPTLKSRLKLPQKLGVPTKFGTMKFAITLDKALDDLGIDLNDRVSTVITRLRQSQALQRLRELESGRALTMDDGEVLPATDIGDLTKRVWVVTTATLPWMTGTAVNPLLRAAYLARGRDKGMVTIMVPWLEDEDQVVLFGEKKFDHQEEQEKYLRKWLRDASMEKESKSLRIYFYPGRYLKSVGSIFPMGDITRLVPDEEAEILIMEEPEHLNWYKATGTNWTKKFGHVVGIIHTNYAYYAKGEEAGNLKEPSLKVWNKLMARAYCDKVIKLSATLQRFAEEKEVVQNVHGVREGFLKVGEKVSRNPKLFKKGAYFIGKSLWEKGLDILFDLMPAEGVDGAFQLDVYGSGPDREEIEAKAEELNLPTTFFDGIDHAKLSEHKILVNPSVSEVLCTTVAEALAMGKFVVIARHPSNEFFYQFPNCLVFESDEEFGEKMAYALANTPEPMSKEYRHILSWEAATSRLIESSKVTVGDSKARRKALDEMAYLCHNTLSDGRRGDTIRKIMFGGKIANQSSFTHSLYDHVEGRSEALVPVPVDVGKSGEKKFLWEWRPLRPAMPGKRGKVEERLEDVYEEAVESMEEAVESMEDAYEEAIESMEDAVEEAVETMGEAVQGAWRWAWAGGCLLYPALHAMSSLSVTCLFTRSLSHILQIGVAKEAALTGKKAPVFFSFEEAEEEVELMPSEQTDATVKSEGRSAKVTSDT
ncbi:unnamed protein product [Chrysoparadoxa australica]